MPFNQQQYNQALQAGYNDAQILDYLAQENMGVNVEQLQQAREAGHVDQAIVNYLMGGAEQTSPNPVTQDSGTSLVAPLWTRCGSLILSYWDGLLKA